MRRRRPIRSHVPQQSTSATRGQSEPSPTIASPASLSHKVAPYTVIDGYSFELQNDQCHKKEYRLAQRCTNCNVKQPGSVCLFQGSRVFVVPKPPSNSIDRTTPTFFATYQPQGSHSKIRSVFNRSLNNDQRNRIAGALSFSMHPTLTQAINHANLPKSILRPNDENDGRKCFYCHGPLFLSYWFCGGCGRDYCPACYDAIRDCLPSEGELLVATDPQSALRAAKHGSDSEANSSSLSQTSMTPIEEHIDVERRYLHDLERLPESVQVQKESITDSMTQKLLTCARRRLHGEDHFIPVTTCSASDLDCIAEECDRLNANRKQLLHSQPGTSEAAQDQPVRTPFSEAMTWETQKPTLITGVGEKLEIDWTPENFCNAFARITCQVQDSQSLHRRDMLVRDFFQQYGSTRKRGDILTIDVSAIFESRLRGIVETDNFSFPSRIGRKRQNSLLGNLTFTKISCRACLSRTTPDLMERATLQAWCH